MRLNHLPSLTVVDSRVFLLLKEASSLGRWRFDYSGRKVYDPKPDVLILGAYVHPSTGNRLVGGINLNYLTSAENDELERVLPEIVKGRNLYERYNIGRLLSPTLFDTYYRTYNSDHISMIGRGRVYPKFGTFVKQPDDTKKFKPITPQPVPPRAGDIKQIEADKPAAALKDVAVPTGPGKEPPQPAEPPPQDIEMKRHETQVQDEIENAEEIPAPPPPEQYEAPEEGEQPVDQMPDFEQIPEEPDQVEEPPEPEDLTVERNIPPEAIEATDEESDDLDSLADHDEDELKESIRYYSPKTGRYITEQWMKSR